MYYSIIIVGSYSQGSAWDSLLRIFQTLQMKMLLIQGSELLNVMKTKGRLLKMCLSFQGLSYLNRASNFLNKFPDKKDKYLWLQFQLDTAQKNVRRLTQWQNDWAHIGERGIPKSWPDHPQALWENK